MPITPHPITGYINASNTTFQHRFICLLFFVRLLNRSIPFLFPIILSVHQYVGHCFSKHCLDYACNIIRTFFECKLYSSATIFCFHSQFRQPIRHSNPILFIDTRHVSMPPLVDFSHIACISTTMHATVSVYLLQDVTPSFQISNYQFTIIPIVQFCFNIIIEY